MVSVGTKVLIADNTGGLTGRCLKVLGNKVQGTIGDLIVLSIREVKHEEKVKRKMICYALILRTGLPYRRRDGSQLRFDRNSVILLNKKKLPIGTRVKGPVVHELRESSGLSIISLSSKIV